MNWPKCKRCLQRPIALTSRCYCFRCRAAINRRLRKDPSAEQKARGRVRARSNYLLQKGVLKRQPCGSCGKPTLDMQMHHPDYDDAMNVVWKCLGCAKKKEVAKPNPRLRIPLAPGEEARLANELTGCVAPFPPPKDGFYTIYGLRDPRTRQVRYIGRTGCRSDRFHSHCRAEDATLRSVWIRELKKQGLLPAMFSLETCESRRSSLVRERHWIRQAKASDWQILNGSRIG